MKRAILKRTIALLLCAGAMSCNQDDYFELERPQETQWVNTVTFDQGLATAYAKAMYGLRGTPQMMDFAESGISQLLPGTSTGAPWNQMYNRLFGENHNQTNDIWNHCYNAVTLANIAIRLDEDGAGNPFNLSVNDPDYTDNYVRQLGEFYFIRAYAYYFLVRTFAPPYDHNGSNDQAYIPLITNVATTREEILAQELGSTDDIYNQMIADLQIAKEKLPEEYNSGTMLPTYQAGRANKYVAASMLAKIYFLKGDYVNAEKEADFVINAAETTGRYALEEPIEAFNKNVVTAIPKEAILEYNTGDPSIGNGEQASNYMYWGWNISLQDRDADDFGRGEGMSKSGVTQFTLSYSAIDLIGWMEDPLNGDYTITDQAKEDLRFQQVYYHLLGYKADGDPFIYETLPVHSEVTTPQIYVDKYYRGGPGDGRYTKFPLIRLADIYLTRAWLRWKRGDAAGAAGDLNKVWNRSNPGNPDRYNASNVSHDTIFAEYIREMSGEGHTLDFMVGTQMPVPPGDRENVAPVPPPYSDWRWIVPVKEIALNPDYQ